MAGRIRVLVECAAIPFIIALGISKDVRGGERELCANDHRLICAKAVRISSPRAAMLLRTLMNFASLPR